MASIMKLPSPLASRPIRTFRSAITLRFDFLDSFDTIVRTLEVEDSGTFSHGAEIHRSQGLRLLPAVATVASAFGRFVFGIAFTVARKRFSLIDLIRREVPFFITSEARFIRQAELFS